MKKNIFFILLVVVSNLLFMSCQNDDVPYIQPSFTSEEEGMDEEEEQGETTIVLDQRDLELFTLDTATLNATVTGGDGSGRVIWRTNDEDILEVDQLGNVTALNVGSAYVVAKMGDATAVCQVRVNPSIYAAGFEIIDGVDYTAKLWKNGMGTNLPSGSFAQSVFVHNGDVYACGSNFWKNGAVSDLSDTIDFFAESIYINDNGIYVAGTDFENDLAKVWENGAITNLTDGSYSAGANSVYVSGSDVYVVGYEYGKSQTSPMLWKNGTPTNLEAGFLGFAYSVFVKDDDVYVSGTDYTPTPRAVIWKNSTPTYLTDGSNRSRAYSIVVSDNDVYACGYEFNGTNDVAKVWKNGTEIELTDGSNPARAYSIVISGEDIYVAGYESNGTNLVAKVWKNGEFLMNLSDGSNRAVAYSIFVE